MTPTITSTSENGDVLIRTSVKADFCGTWLLSPRIRSLTPSDMSESAESFNPRTKEHQEAIQEAHLTEIQRLWLEYSERFRYRLRRPQRPHRVRRCDERRAEPDRPRVPEAQPFRFLYEFDAETSQTLSTWTHHCEKYPAT